MFQFFGTTWPTTNWLAITAIRDAVSTCPWWGGKSKFQKFGPAQPRGGGGQEAREPHSSIPVILAEYLYF